MTSDEQSNSTFAEAFRGFLLAKQAEKVTASMLTLYRWTHTYWQRRMGDAPLAAIEPGHVREFLLWLHGQDDSGIEPPHGRWSQRLSGSSIDIHFRNLRAFFNWCEEEELIARSPMRKVKRPRFEQVLPSALTEAEVVYLLESVRGSGDRNAFRDYLIHLFMLDTGVRLAELAGLTVDAVNLEEGYAKVLGKGRRERLVPLGIELRRGLSRYLLKMRRPVNGERALFLNEYGLRFEAGGIQTMVLRDLNRYITRADLKRRGPHTLRHTFATLNLRRTHDLAATSKILGHRSTRTTERYIHLTGTDVLRNAEGSPMDSLLRDRGNGRDTSHSTSPLE